MGWIMIPHYPRFLRTDNRGPRPHQSKETPSSVQKFRRAYYSKIGWERGKAKEKIGEFST